MLRKRYLHKRKTIRLPLEIIQYETRNHKDKCEMCLEHN